MIFVTTRLVTVRQAKNALKIVVPVLWGLHNFKRFVQSLWHVRKRKLAMLKTILSDADDSEARVVRIRDDRRRSHSNLEVWTPHSGSQGGCILNPIFKACVKDCEAAKAEGCHQHRPLSAV